MQSSSVKRVVVFIAVGLVLVLAVVAGMRWAKGRAEVYAHQQSQTVSQPTPQAQPKKDASPQPPTPSPVVTSPAPSAPPVASQPAPSPQTVPATGPQEAMLSIVSLALVVFTAIRYAQARHKLLNLR